MNKKMVLIMIGVVGMISCAQAAEKEELSSALKQLIIQNDLGTARELVDFGVQLTDTDLDELLPNADYNARLVKLGIVPPPPAAKPASSARATTVPAATTAAKPTIPAVSTATRLTPPAATTAVKPIDAAARPVKTKKEVEEIIRNFYSKSYNDFVTFIQNNSLDKESVNAVCIEHMRKNIYRSTLFSCLVSTKMASHINYASMKKLIVDGLDLHAPFTISDAYREWYDGTTFPASKTTTITAKDFVFNVAKNVMSKISDGRSAPRLDLIAPTRQMLQALIDGLHERSVQNAKRLQEQLIKEPKTQIFGSASVPELYGIIAEHAGYLDPQDQAVFDAAEKLLAELNKLAASKGK